MRKMNKFVGTTILLILILLFMFCENKSVVKVDIDETPPTVSITSPLNNTTIFGTISIHIDASDNVGLVKLEIYIDGILTLTDDSPSGEYTWDTTLESDGYHTLLAQAYDEANNIGVSSTITVTVANSFEVTFNNQAFTEIDLTVAGQGVNTIDAGSSLTLTYSINPGSLVCSGETSGQTSAGSQIGEKIIWDFTEDVTGRSSQTFNLAVDSDWFFIYVRNNGPHDLNPFYVNYGTANQTHDDILIPGDGIKYQIGYYRAFTNTEIRAYWDNSSTYALWIQGTQFSLPFTTNQSVTLVNNSLLVNSVIGEQIHETSNKKREPVVPQQPIFAKYKNVKTGKMVYGKGIQ